VAAKAASVTGRRLAACAIGRGVCHGHNREEASGGQQLVGDERGQKEAGASGSRAGGRRALGELSACVRLELGGGRWIRLEWVRWAGLFDVPYFQSNPTVPLYSFLLDIIYVFVQNALKRLGERKRVTA